MIQPPRAIADDCSGSSTIIPLAFLYFLIFAGLLFALFPSPVQGQSRKPVSVSQTNKTLLKQTTTRVETKKLGYGGTVTLVGAPQGSITIEGWANSQVEVTADIELQAETEEDLARLATVNNFLVASDPNHVRVLTTGTHDRKTMRRIKDFPRKLAGLPWKIDYRIRVPLQSDLEVDAGRGNFKLAGVEGAIRLTALESDANLAFSGGLVRVTIGRGNVTLDLVSRSWRGSGAEIRLASGELNVELPAGFNADIDAEILRVGTIENSYPDLQPRDENLPFTPRSLKGRAGAGGAPLLLTVAEGKMRISQSAR